MPLRDETPTEVTDGVLEEYSPLRRLWRSTRSLPPMLIARAGKEERPWLNPTIDRFVVDAIARGAEVDLLNHPRGRHAFDVLEDDPRSQDIIARTLDFLVRHATA
jgi:hypothetical protein